MQLQRRVTLSSQLQMMMVFARIDGRRARVGVPASGLERRHRALQICLRHQEVEIDARTQGSLGIESFTEQRPLE